MEDIFRAKYFERLAKLEELINRAKDLISDDGDYDEAIGCLHQSLKLAPPEEPFMRFHIKAIIYLGQAHICKNDYESAIDSLAMIPDGISLQQQFIPLNAIEKFLEMGYEAISVKNYSKAQMIYKAIVSTAVAADHKVRAQIGAAIAKYKKDNNSLVWLRKSIKDIEYEERTGWFCEIQWLPIEKWAKRFMESGEKSRSEEDMEGAIEDLRIAQLIFEVTTDERNKPHLFEIHKRLAKSYCKLQKCKETIQCLETCSKLKPKFYVGFWTSQETKGNAERERNADDKALERFRLLSHTITKMPGTNHWKENIVDFYLVFNQMVVKKGLYEEAVDNFDNIIEYLKSNAHKDQNLCEEMKQFGDVLTKKNEHSLAKRVYSYALDIVPDTNTELKRDLLSNRSYMYELLGNYDGALTDAKKCSGTFPKWPMGHLRLGRAYFCKKEYTRAFNAFSTSYKLSTNEDQPKILERLLTTKLSAGNEKQRNSMSLPKDIAVDVLNNCFAILVSDGSQIALDSVHYLLTEKEYSNHIYADKVCLASLMQKKAPDDMVLLLIQKGAQLTGTPSALDVFIEHSNDCQQNNQILLHLIKMGVDVSKYITVMNGEPWQHTLVRLCVERDKLDALSEVAQSVDFGVTDEKGNNLLHVLARMNYSTIVFNCMKLITKRVRINPKLKNTDGKKPVDFIKDRDDCRFTFLEDLEAKNGTCEGKKKKMKKKKREETKDTVNLEAIDESIKEPLPATKDALESSSVLAEADYVKHGSGEQESRNTTGTAENVLRLIQEFVQVNLDDRHTAAINEREHAHESENIVEMPSEESIETADTMVVEDSSENEDETSEGNVFQVLNEEFEGLPWEVQCTAEFWKKLKDPKLDSIIKQIILSKIKLLASGDWRPKLAKKIEGPQDIRLYKARLTKGARMIWEEAIAFSERQSEGDTDSLIYTDVIRLWNFTLRHDEVPRLIERISVACTRGQSSTVTKSLKVKCGPKMKDDKRLPRMYCHASESPIPSQPKNGDKSSNQLFFPPASSNDREFHILKFYALSNAMAKCLLQNTGRNFDFPFQVSELEHRIIRLRTQPSASILLLGRSGTGKTTCCLYRLWSTFKAYWEIAETAGAHIPILQILVEVDSSEESSCDDDDDGSARAEVGQQGAVLPSDKNAKSTIMSCGCRDVCMCAIAMARSNYSGTLNEDENSYESGLKADQRAEIKQAGDSMDDERAVNSEDWSSDENNQYRHLRQLFITKNKVLCHEVKKNFRDLCNGLSVVEEHVSIFSEDTIGNLNNIDDLSYPLFVGSRDLLLALDETLPGKPFFARLPNGKLLAPVAGWGEKDSHLSSLPIFDSEEEDDEEDDEEDLDDAQGDTEMKKSQVKRKANKVKREITYTIFVHEVWPEIEKKSSSGYHPSLVWTEFCSFIKGTVEALSSHNGCMSEEQYHKIGRKKAPNFLGDRNVIYDMFRRYQKICISKYLFDEFDVLHNIYKRLALHPIQPWLLDQIYVDEAQDFTEAELFLLIRCCQDPNELFFTGDTAQSIMRGVTFRFSDLRSLFFNAKEAFSTAKKSPIEVPKEVHQLKYNYRSHKGILKLASSIVHLLGFFFPESFDRLEDDVGLFDGPKPVILETRDFAELALMLRGARRKTSPIEFGAHQVVLVSSETSKEELPEELKCALVLTIYESKGLEFDDVLLYNFFKDSQANKEWRVISSYLDTQACKDAFGNKTNEIGSDELVSKPANQLSFASRPLTFDDNKHKILNSELKQLYTAITRARVNVWIYDEDEESRAPMFNYFDKLGLVEILRLDGAIDDAVGEKGMFASESSTADWEQQGHYFYKKELWNVAIKCFEKTQNREMVRRCEAHMQAMKAYKMGMEWRQRRGSGSLRSVHMEYVKASEYYLQCGMGEEAAICLKNAREWKLLGEFMLKLGRFRQAGRYFVKAATAAKDAKDDSVIKASDSYRRCGDFRNATDVLYKNKQYLECIKVIKEYEMEKQVPTLRLQPPRSTLRIENIVREAADACVKRKDMSLLKEYMSELTIDNQLEYLSRKPGCEEIALEILIDNGRAEEAAEIHMRKGRYLKAASCTMKKVTKGICYLEQARLIYSKGSNDIESSLQQVIDSALQYLNMAIPCLPDDAENLADCYFMIGVLTDKLQFIKYAAELFGKSGNYVGLLLCNKKLWSKGEITSNIVVESLNKMLLLVGRRSTKRMKMLQNYFGIEKVPINDAELYFRINRTKLQLHLDWLVCSKGHIEVLLKHFDGNEEGEGNARIFSAIFNIANLVVQTLMTLYDKELQNSEICFQYLQGIPHEECGLEHKCPSLKTIQNRCTAYCAILQMHGLLRERMTEIFKTSKLKEHANRFEYLTCYTDDKMIETCHSFYQDLMCFTQFLSRTQYTGMHLVRSFPEMSFAKDQIHWCIKSIWQKAGDKGRFSDMNVFLEVFTLSSYAGTRFVQYAVDSIHKEIETRYGSEKRLTRNEIALFNTREERYETFHTMFMDSKLWMHDDGALIECLHVLLRRGLTLVVRRDVPPPSLTNSVTLLEFSLSLCLISLSRTNRKFVIYLPEFYTEAVQFWSGCYTSCFNAKYSAFDNIDYVTKGNKVIKSLVIVILDLLSGKKSDRFDLIDLAFGDTDLLVRDLRHRADAERFLVLVLVILGNHRIFSDDPASVRPIVLKLIEHARKDRKVPGFIPGALDSASRFQSPDDAITALKKILQQSGRAVSAWTWKTIRSYYLQREANEEKPRTVQRPTREEKGPVINDKQPTVILRPDDSNLVQKKNEDKGDGLSLKQSTSAYTKAEDENDSYTKAEDEKGPVINDKQPTVILRPDDSNLVQKKNEDKGDGLSLKQNTSAYTKAEDENDSYTKAEDEKGQVINDKQPTVILRPDDSNLVQKKNEDKGDGLSLKQSTSAYTKAEDENDSLQDVKDHDDKSKHGKEVEILRGISYEDEYFDDMRDNEATRKAHKERRIAYQSATCKIQRWWRIVMGNRVRRKREEEKLSQKSRIEEHCRKYVSDLWCEPCGRRFGTREELHTHILEGESHDQCANSYSKFISYKKSVVDHWLKQAEELLDRNVLGQAIVELEIAEKLHEAIGVVSVCMNRIEKTRSWAELNDLKSSVTALQRAYHELEEEVLKMDDDYAVNDADDDDEEEASKKEEFEPVSKRKGKSSRGKARKKGRKWR